MALVEKTGRPSLQRNKDPGGIFCSSPLSPPLPAPHVVLHPQRGLNEDVTTVRTTRSLVLLPLWPQPWLEL